MNTLKFVIFGRLVCRKNHLISMSLVFSMLMLSVPEVLDYQQVWPGVLSASWFLGVFAMIRYVLLWILLVFMHFTRDCNIGDKRNRLRTEACYLVFIEAMLLIWIMLIVLFDVGDMSLVVILGLLLFSAILAELDCYRKGGDFEWAVEK